MNYKFGDIKEFIGDHGCLPSEINNHDVLRDDMVQNEITINGNVKFSSDPPDDELAMMKEDFINDEVLEFAAASLKEMGFK